MSQQQQRETNQQNSFDFDELNARVNYIFNCLEQKKPFKEYTKYSFLLYMIVNLVGLDIINEINNDNPNECNKIFEKLQLEINQPDIMQKLKKLADNFKLE